MYGNIVSLQIGKPQVINFDGQEINTGIYKAPVNQPIFLSSLHFAGDGQADLVHHGGVDKAVCVYCFEHYPYWEGELGKSLEPGAFGENITVTGLLEQDVYLGDIFQLGEALVQISQPRRPCYKLAKRHARADLPVLVQETGYTGYYFRVLKEGMVSPRDTIKLKERPVKSISVADANQIMYRDRNNREAIEQILAVESLSASWQRTFQKRLAGIEEDPTLRLKGKK